MPLILIFTNSFIIGFSGAMMPGPLLTVDISASLKRGFWAGPIVVAGHAVTEIAIVLAIYLGLTKLVSQPQVFFWIAVIGGSCLILIGAVMFLDVIRKKTSLKLVDSPRISGKKTAVLAGAVSISSPYWILWWLTIGTLLISQSLSYGIVGLIVFYFGHILADLVWYSVVSFLVSRGKKYFNDFLYNLLLVVCGLFLIALGIYFIDSAMSGAFEDGLHSLIGS